MQMNIGRALLAAMLLITATQCKEKEDLDADLVPAVDNISTFFSDTTGLKIVNIAFDSLHTSIKDQQATATSSYIPYAYASLHALGDITTDPIFGETHANIALQFKQQLTSLKFPTDRMIIDSLVLQLPYLGFYGDKFKSTPLQYNVYRLPTAMNGGDTIYNSHTTTVDNSMLLGSTVADLANIDTTRIENNVKVKALRIPLDTNFARQLVNLRDTVEYKDYPSFVNWLRGIYIQSATPNKGVGIATIAISDATIKLYYRVYNGTDTTKQTSTYRYEPNYCAHYNEITRNHNGTPFLPNINTVNSDNLYLQSDCGGALEVTIPSTQQFKNSVINKATLQFSVVASGNSLSDTVFALPGQIRIVGIDSNGKVVKLPFSNTTSGALVSSAVTVTENGVTERRYVVNITKTLQQIAGNNSSKIAKLVVRGEGGLRSGAGRVVLGGPNRFAQKAKINVIYTKLN
jgi:hypothetical protein